MLFLENIMHDLHLRLPRTPRSTDRLKQTGNCIISPQCRLIKYLPMAHILQESRGFSCKISANLFQGIYLMCIFFQILILLFGLLSFCSYAFLSIWRRNDERDDEFLPYSWEDEIVYKVYLYGFVLLLMYQHLSRPINSSYSFYRLRSPSAHSPWLCRWAPPSSFPSQLYPTRWVIK